MALGPSVCLDTTACTPTKHVVLYVGSRLVSFGAIFGLTTATFACLMGQPRIFYSMAQDGLLFRIYSRVHPKTGVPTIGTILTGIFTALIACFIDLESLANAISLGTLQVFTFVNAGVIILRMRPASESDRGNRNDEMGDTDETSALWNPNSPLVRDPEAASLARSMGIVKKSSVQIRESLRQSLSSGSMTPLNVEENGSKPHWLTFLVTISSTLASAAFSSEWHVGVVMISILVVLVCAVLLMKLPTAPPPETFTCPWVPVVPLCGIVSNSYMMGSMPVRVFLLSR